MEFCFESAMWTATKSLRNLGLEDQGATVVFGTDEFFGAKGMTFLL